MIVDWWNTHLIATSMNWRCYGHETLQKQKQSQGHNKENKSQEMQA
jgi:hypothetical protein